ncbi:hypothetical protein KBY31_21095 [Ruegeria pomeroyi]|nr:hypothetical protein [Ruegeria pomeroyi]
MANSECSDVLQEHLLDKTYYSSYSDLRYLYASRYANSEWGEVKKELDSGITAWYGAIGLDAEIDESQFRKWQSEVRKTLDIEEIQKHSTSIYLSSATDTMIQAWTACMTTRKNYGVHIRLEPINEKRAHLRLLWIPDPVHPEKPKIEGIYFEGATILDGKEYLKEDEEVQIERLITLEIDRKKSHVLFSLNSTTNPTTAYLPRLVDLPEVPKIDVGRVSYLDDFKNGGWKEIDGVPNDALPVSDMAGVVNYGPVLVGGKRADKVYFMRDYSDNNWRGLPNAPFKVKWLAGNNSTGIIACGGESGTSVGYLRDYSNGNWTLVSDPPFSPTALSGDNNSGPVISGGKGGREIAYLSNYSSPVWKTVEAPCPFRILGFAGDNRKGVVAFGGPNRNRVAYLKSYAGDWVKLPDAPSPISAIAGNNNTGPQIYCGESNTFYYLRNYSSPSWVQLAADFSNVTQISGHNSSGLLVLRES